MIDEIGTEAECAAARTIAQRGARCCAKEARGAARRVSSLSLGGECRCWALRARMERRRAAGGHRARQRAGERGQEPRAGRPGGGYPERHTRRRGGAQVRAWASLGQDEGRTVGTLTPLWWPCARCLARRWWPREFHCLGACRSARAGVFCPSPHEPVPSVAPGTTEAHATAHGRCRPPLALPSDPLVPCCAPQAWRAEEHPRARWPAHL